MRRLPLALAAALLFTAGCDSLDDDLFGEFTADVTVDGQAEANALNDPDDEDDDLMGEAVYTVIETAYGPEFVVGLFVGDLFDSQYDEYQFITFRRKGGVPGVGGYAIEEDPERSGVAATYARVLEADEPLEATGPVLNGLDGVLVITEVDPLGVVAGTFRFDARGVLVQETGRFVEGEASGRFEARYERPDLVLGRGLNL
jgi:hypothetical protein